MGMNSIWALRKAHRTITKRAKRERVSRIEAAAKLYVETGDPHIWNWYVHMNREAEGPKRS